jgi:hypothetical protein
VGLLIHRKRPQLTLPTQSSSVLVWFFLAMIAYPEKQKRCQEELDVVVGRSRRPTFEDQENLPYIQATVRESLRWRSVTPLGMFSFHCLARRCTSSPLVNRLPALHSTGRVEISITSDGLSDSYVASRMIGIRDISSLKVPSVSQMSGKLFILRSLRQLIIGAGVSIAINPSM